MDLDARVTPISKIFFAAYKSLNFTILLSVLSLQNLPLERDLGGFGVGSLGPFWDPRVHNNPNHLQLTDDSSVKHLSAAKK